MSGQGYVGTNNNYHIRFPPRFLFEEYKNMFIAYGKKSLRKSDEEEIAWSSKSRDKQ